MDATSQLWYATPRQLQTRAKRHQKKVVPNRNNKTSPHWRRVDMVPRQMMRRRALISHCFQSARIILDARIFIRVPRIIRFQKNVCFECACCVLHSYDLLYVRNITSRIPQYLPGIWSSIWRSLGMSGIVGKSPDGCRELLLRGDQ